MRRFRQREFYFRWPVWFRVNMFSLPTKHFDHFGVRLVVELGDLHVMATWQPGKNRKEKP